MSSFSFDSMQKFIKQSVTPYIVNLRNMFTSYQETTTDNLNTLDTDLRKQLKDLEKTMNTKDQELLDLINKILQEQLAAINKTILEVKDNTLPIGSIVAWPVAKNPDVLTVYKSWLECLGQTISAAEYPDLITVLGTNKVPDYRGVFLRGHGSVTSTHYGSVTHQSAGLGILQGDAIRNIYGEITRGAVEEGARFTGCFYACYYSKGAPGDARDYGIGFDASRVVPTANEDRPINKAVRWFIKAK